ncbi:NADH-quinone oxidoreductase subunit H [Candidatus Fermentibacteria bacterium]|nr:NADH-quinone oxidoreductase subunit H [Candidatus Fermentibacteria bacterium]
MTGFFLLDLLLFGVVITAVAGMAASWVDRKVTARVQYRVGPPPLQPFTDIVKLMGKETLVPAGVSRAAFLSAPLLGFCAVAAVSTVLWVNQLSSGGFAGDWIVVLYLLTIPSMGIIMGGFASKNPYASLGSSREMKLVMAYELPFVLAILVPVIQSGFAMRLGDILADQAAYGAMASSLSGAIALAVAILCMQAKLALVPFDAPEAETELAGGVFIEYSGAPLAVFKLTKNMLLFVLPFFLSVMFLGGFRFDGIEILWTVLKFVGLVALVTVIRNTNPRVRIDQALRFFWGPVTIAAAAAVVLAFLGL